MEVTNSTKTDFIKFDVKPIQANKQQLEDGTDPDRISYSHSAPIGADRGCGSGFGNTGLHPPQKVRVVHKSRDKSEETLVGVILRSNNVEKTISTGF